MPMVPELRAGNTGAGLLEKSQTFLQNISNEANPILFPALFPLNSCFFFFFSQNNLGCSVPFERSGPFSAWFNAKIISLGFLFVCSFVFLPIPYLDSCGKKKKVRKEKENNTSVWKEREESVWEMSNRAENPWTFSRNPHPLELWIRSVYQNTLWCIAVRKQSRPSAGKGF